MSELLENITVYEYEKKYFNGEKLTKENEELSKIVNPEDFELYLELGRNFILLLSYKYLVEIGREQKDIRKEIEFSRVQKNLLEIQNSGSSERMKKETFVRWVMNVGKWLGLWIDKKKVSMLEFAVATHDMIKENKIKAQNKK